MRFEPLLQRGEVLEHGGRVHLTFPAERLERLMRGVPGFIAYALFRTSDGGISVTICQSQAGIDESIARAARWVQENVPVATDPPEVCDGWIVSVDRQTAISEVLKLISRSDFDLEAIMRVLLENAVRFFL